MVSVRESEVDGVPCFWVDSGRPTLAASLLFRQGMADEPLHESGWLHLLEHMVLHGTGNASLHVNGSVSPLITTFDTHGPPEGVAHHLTRLASWLGNPVLRDVERERRVLRAESQMRGGPFMSSLRWRYGAQGPGVASYAEPGLVRATPEVLWDRCVRVFNRGNAVLVLDGPPPHRLRLGLAEGSFLPPTPATSTESTFPLAYREDAGLVLSGVVERSHDAGVAVSLLERALREEVRERAGAAYAPWATYEAVDAHSAVIAAGSDLQPEVLGTILDKSLLVLDRLRSGAPQGWIEEQVEARLQALRDPYNAGAIALRAGHAVLSEKLPPTYDELIAESAQTDREQVRRAFEQLQATLLLGAPARAKLPKRIPRADFPVSRPWREGRARRHRNWPLDRTRFSVGTSGVQLVQGGDALCVPHEETSALFIWEDGTRHVVGRDGWSLTMSPSEWRGGAELARAMDSTVPGHLHLPLEGPGSGDFRRLSWRKRWYPRLRASFRSAPGRALLAVLLALVGIVSASQHLDTVAGLFVFLALVCLMRVPYAYFRGRRTLW